MKSQLLERAKNAGTPLIEGNQVTFLWAGEQPPLLKADFTGWDWGEPVELNRLQRNLWSFQVELPQDAYMEYAFISPVDPELRFGDPFNPRRTPNGMGKHNHYFYMPQAAPTPLVNRQRNVSRGQVTRYEVDTWGMVHGKKRTLRLYSPARSSAAREPLPLPLLVVYDGSDYVRRARMPEIVDNLIALGRIQPISIAFVDNGGAARSPEYTCAESTLGFLFEKVLPLARQHLNLVDIKEHPGAFSVMGASLGGLMAVFTALRMPEIFGCALSQSGAFDLMGREAIVFDLVRYSSQQSIRFWLDAGLYDLPGLLEANRRFHALLVERGFPVSYHEFTAGHNYPAWRNDLAAGLEFLFGGEQPR